ncbi:MAG: hypothetical protein WCF26_06130 [Candidatus Sulfotelmatobacter sp.]
MTEQHGHELSPTTESASVALGPVLGNRLLELLRENNCNIWLKMLDTRITAVVALPYDSRLATQTVAEFYPRRSKPNLDKSE